MADESDNKDSSEKENTTYVRKKNIIPGWDNDHLMLTGLGVLTAITLYPYARQWVENIFKSIPQPGQQQGQPQGQGQLPPNGSGVPQITIPNPPDTSSQQHKVYVAPQQQEAPQGHNLLEDHERGLREQAAYAAAVEKENLTGSQSINMVPDRNVAAERKARSQAYEAGSNVSAGYT